MIRDLFTPSLFVAALLIGVACAITKWWFR
jgi:hypothetical protein